ncbi:MAG TPA: ATP-binding protein, partial [Kofleriaceae bacterium]|nr:ATP-binding protein [Kofleriaceae bacterium]
DERARVLAQFLDGARGPVVLVSTRAGVDVGARLPSVRVDWPVPDVATRIRLWTAAVGAPADDGGDHQLAVRFPLGAGAIRRAVESARLLARGRGAGGALTSADLMAGVRHNIAERLGTVAERIQVKQRWDDLVLADDAMSQVKAVVARVRHAHAVYEEWGYRSKMPRGVGVAALFSGPPGTGKTMVAGLIAQELDLDLYQIDLSKVVSKWVGETEKQLANVFDAAEAGHALLLFDEADALFGQRTSDVKGANDRYANLEVNFLLQRIENFGGVVILTTNLDASIDKALKRRLAAHVVFPHPDDDERAVLWQRLLHTDGAPLADDLDVVDLANAFPKMTGANIRNAALGAAFLAVAEGRRVIDHDLVRQAARNEYLAMGQVLAAPPGRR